MQKRVPKPFTLLLFLFLLSNYLSASPDCPIITGRFQQADGTTSDASANGWYLNAANVASTGYFSVKSNRLHAQELGGVGIWYSRVFSTAGYSEFQAAVKITSEGDMNSSEYVQIYYKIDGGAETLWDSRTGNFGTIDFTSPVLTGSNIQLVVKIYNYNNGGSQTSKYYIEEYRVFKDKGPCAVSAITATATAANGGILTCTNPSLGLSATATGSGTTTWSWSGPGGFTSTLQNPTITAAGTYTVVATNSTGTGSASVTVSENKTAPVITATGGGLACGSCVTISATSNVSGATYSWSGPGSFTSTSQNPTVCAVGAYTVTVTNPANGCSAQQSVSVTAGTVATFWLEDFTGLSNGTTSDAGTTQWTTAVTGSGTYSVQSNEYKVSFSGGPGIGVWTSQAIDISSKTNVAFSVDLRSEVASSNDAFENTDYIRVYYKLNGGAETLVYEDLAGLGTTTNSTASVTVSSAALNGSSLQVIIKTSNSDPTEKYYFDNIKITGSDVAGEDVTANATGGTINCINNSVALQGSSAASGVSYTWSGPNGYTSNAQNPVVTNPGTYTLTVAMGGCTATADATVSIDTTKPAITALATPEQLTCTATPAILSGGSSTPGVNYSWSNADSIIASTPNISVTTPGNYTLTVTNPANGCSSSSQVTVTQNVVIPTAVTATHTGIINCFTPTISILATASSPGISYSWSGPNGFSAATFNASVTRGGTYTFTATDTTNGCFSSASTLVEENTTPPGEISINNSGTITCLTSSVTITGSSSSSGVNYKWEGPNGYSGTSPSATVTQGGLYTLTATDPGNGCTSSKSTNVAENTAAPVVTISNTSPLSCLNPTVTLSANTNTPNASVLWIGPEDYIDVATTTTVNIAGVYIITVTDPANGCITTDFTEVTEDYSDCAARKATTVATTPAAAQNATTVNGTGFTYKAYPNPVIANGVIEFASPRNANATVSIYNTLGACEKVLFKGSVTAGRWYRIAVPAAQLHAGAYYYIIDTGGKTYTGKLAIVK